eukprot:TRINITY_DN8153_c0_g1_i4.p1 TRINITY_DN8153_c0_g1~~TRINITY_DN8153_c0_g1_i4.p1  ORF type:complete len:236 (-),score=50.95 TRINITY_DN8153_c0_g1_i4:188-895(-)
MESTEPLVLRSGNVYACFPCIQDWHTGMDELAHGLEIALTKLVGTGDCASCEDSSAKLPPEYVKDIEQLSIIGKLYLGPLSTPKDVQHALDETLRELHVDKLDKVIVCFHESLHSSNQQIASLWAVVEKFQDAGFVKTTAVKNFTVSKLETFFSIIKNRPTDVCVDVEHVRLHTDLKEYAESQGMTLIVHGPSDQSGLFAAEAIPSILSKYNIPKTNFSLRWMVRFAVVRIFDPK